MVRRQVGGDFEPAFDAVCLMSVGMLRLRYRGLYFNALAMVLERRLRLADVIVAAAIILSNGGVVPRALQGVAAALVVGFPPRRSARCLSAIRSALAA
jgi:hypothetical protein